MRLWRRPISLAAEHVDKQLESLFVALRCLSGSGAGDILCCLLSREQADFAIVASGRSSISPKMITDFLVADFTF